MGRSSHLKAAMGADHGVVQMRSPMGARRAPARWVWSPLPWEEQQGWPGSVWGREGIWPVQRPRVGGVGANLQLRGSGPLSQH